LGKPLWFLQFEHPYEIVGTFLHADVGFTKQSCNYFRGKAIAVYSEGHAPLTTGGNAFRVYMIQEWVLVKSQFDEDSQPVVLSMPAFLSLLNYWKSIVSFARKQIPPEDYPGFCYDDSAVLGISPESVQAEFKRDREESEEKTPESRRFRRRR